MTETSIIKTLRGWLDNKKFPFQLANAFIYAWECDYWCMTAGGETREFEIKIGRPDFFADFKKEKHKIDTGANYFYYVCPDNLITPKEVPDKYGLIYVSESGYVKVIKNPRRLNNNEFSRWREFACKMYWKWRDLWRDKCVQEEITIEEYREGFTIELLQEEAT